MPVFQFDPQEGSCWGYMPLNFFAPHHGYGSRPEECDQHNEFRAMVKALHAADIEVILDVVYNHTAEGDQRGPIYSYKGIDNSTYYLMSGNPGSPYADFSGTGNTLRCSEPAVRRLIVDSVRFWFEEMHVDGFRFDLASVLTRNDDGSLNWEDPIDLSRRAPWTSASSRSPGTPRGRTSSDARSPSRAVCSGTAASGTTCAASCAATPGMVPALMQRLYGSDDLFPDDRMHAFHPYQSVNYVTCHDGFTLYDLVSYDRKHNQANGHNNTDGPEENFSWNCGWEGDEGSPGARVGAAEATGEELLLLAVAGERDADVPRGRRVLADAGRQQQSLQPGQHDELARLGPSPLSNQDVFRFFRSMIGFRKAHPSLGRSRFWREDVRWYGTGPDGGHGARFPHAGRLPARSLATGHRSLRDDQCVGERRDASRSRKGGPANGGWPSTPGWAARTTFLSRAKRACLRSSSYVVHSHSIAGMTRDGLTCPSSDLQSRSESPPVYQKRVPV